MFVAMNEIQQPEKLKNNDVNGNFVCTGPDPPHGYSDSSDMVKTILQTVQNQDRVLKDLYSHLR